MNLKTTNIVFDEEQHKYFDGERELSGVTPIIAWMFPDTYRDIPDDVLKRAAEYGKDIHRRCNLLDLTGIMDSHHSVQEYAQLKEQYGLKAETVEYLVTNHRVASSIDVIFTGHDNRLLLADIKTTSQIHTENVTLQLSIYAHLFEQQNPGLHVDGLLVVWLPKQQYGKPAIIECKRVSDILCELCINEYLCGSSSDILRPKVLSEIGLPVKAETALPETLRDAEREIANIEKQMKLMKETSDKLREGMLQLMVENNVKKWDGELITLTRKEASVTKRLDTAMLKKEYPEAYNACLKESESKPSLTIKLK